MKMDIFAKHTSTAKYGGHKLRLSTLIRGEQIAKQLDANYHEIGNYENDLVYTNNICIYVKAILTDKCKISKRAYVDIIDMQNFNYLMDHPEIGVITCSERSYEYIKSITHGNKVVLIPQHHCNIEKQIRNIETIKVAGYIGMRGNFKYDLEEVEKRCSDMGIEFIYTNLYRNREDICNFYNRIDVQLDWRTRNPAIVNSLKIINAASFGIVTIAFPNEGYKELNDYYIKAHTIDEMFTSLKKLKEDNSLYKEYAKKAVKKSEEYSIENIAKLYQNLL